jgi:hypothetical protein
VKRWGPLIVAIGAFFLAALVWIGNDRTVAQRAFDDFSIENTSGKGLSLASRYLQRSGHRVVRLDAPLRATLVPAGAVVIRAGEFTSPAFEVDEDRKKPTKKMISALLTAAEDEWVRGGGRLVLATAAGFGPLDIAPVKLTEKTATKVFPIWPEVTSIGLTVPRAIRLATLPPHMHALFTAAGQPAIARESIGAGEVIVIAVPEVLQNSHLGTGNGLALLVALAGPNRPVYFDETIHGFDENDSPFDLMKEWGLGPFLLLIGIVGLLIFWRNATRVGPAEDDYRDTRSDAVDLVRSLGALYKSSTSDDDAIAMYRDALVRSVAAQTGLRGDALNRRVGQLLGNVGPRGFDRNLHAINVAFGKLAGGTHAKHR